MHVPMMVLYFSAGLKEAITNPPIMMPMRQRTLDELGCHLGNQGPRLDHNARGSGDKLATVKQKMKRA